MISRLHLQTFSLFDKVENLSNLYTQNIYQKKLLKINIDDFKTFRESRVRKMSKFFMKKLGFNFKKEELIKVFIRFAEDFLKILE